jgi:hypothetical protein
MCSQGSGNIYSVACCPNTKFQGDVGKCLASPPWLGNAYSQQITDLL